MPGDRPTSRRSTATDRLPGTLAPGERARQGRRRPPRARADAL